MVIIDAVNNLRYSLKYKTLSQNNYKPASIKPKWYDTYLIKTETNCYDFAYFAQDGWHCGNYTDGKPAFWMEIPKKYSYV